MKLTSTLVAIAMAFTLSSTAQADSFFSFSNELDRKSTLELGQVVSEGDGVISIYTYHRRVRGALLGTRNIRAGANYDVSVVLGRRPTTDVLAVLTVNGRVVAMQHYDIERF